MVKMYGIANCDVIKKATDWLKQNHVHFEFHDYKKEGVSATKLQYWTTEKSWEKILNKRSTTWRELTASGVGEIKSTSQAIEIMAANTSVIKRPIIEFDDEILVGFNENEYIQKLITSKKLHL